MNKTCARLRQAVLDIKCESVGGTGVWTLV